MTKLTKLGLDLVRMSWPVDKDGIQRTHFEACYVGHHACAIQRLADEVEMLREAIGEFVTWDKGWRSRQPLVCKPLHRLYEIADKAKKPQ